MRVERELACDEMVLRAGQSHSPSSLQPSPGNAYAHTILKLLETLSAGSDAPAPPPAPPPGALAVGTGPALGILEGREKAQIQRRLVMIARFDTQVRPWSLVGLCLSIVLAAAALCGAVRAQDASDPNAGKRPPQPAANRAPSHDAEGETTDHGAPAATDRLEKIRAAYPRLPALSPQGQKLFSSILQSRTPPNGEDVNRMKEQLWKSLERELIYVPGKPEPVNAQQVQTKYEVDIQALDKWIAAATTVGAWAEPNLRKYAKPAASDPDDPAAAKGREKLRKTVKVSFSGQALADVIDFVRDAGGVDILVDWRSLEAAGITRDAPVELRLNEPVSVAQVLDLICRTVGENHISYEIDRGVVLVSAVDGSRSNMLTRAYDVSDLVNRTPTGPGEGSSMPVHGPGRGTAGGPPAPGAGGADPTAGLPATFVTDNAQLAQLYTLIVQTVEPDSWKEAGGQGTIAPFGAKLIVKNSEAAHRELSELLTMLREKPTNKTEKPR
jgi:hypothetical protein